MLDDDRTWVSPNYFPISKPQTLSCWPVLRSNRISLPKIMSSAAETVEDELKYLSILATCSKFKSLSHSPVRIKSPPDALHNLRANNPNRIPSSSASATGQRFNTKLRWPTV